MIADRSCGGTSVLRGCAPKKMLARTGWAAALARQVAALVCNGLAVTKLLSSLPVRGRALGTTDQLQKTRYGEYLGALLPHIERRRQSRPEDHLDVVTDGLNALVSKVAAHRTPI